MAAACGPPGAPGGCNLSVHRPRHGRGPNLVRAARSAPYSSNKTPPCTLDLRCRELGLSHEMSTGVEGSTAFAGRLCHSGDRSRRRAFDLFPAAECFPENACLRSSSLTANGNCLDFPLDRTRRPEEENLSRFGRFRLALNVLSGYVRTGSGSGGKADKR
jgi:hypothetical protein